MRIGLQTSGSEGDIRPFVALGHALTKRGHAVELLYTEISDRRYDTVAASLGFTARAVASPMVKDPEELFALGLKILHARDPLQQGLLINRHAYEPVVEPVYEATLDLCRRSDLLIHHFSVHPARAAADKIGTPSITVAFAHMLTPSRFIHPPGLPRLGEWGTILEWKLAALVLNRTLLEDVNRWRVRVGLPRIADLMRDSWPSHRLNLLASSPALLDRPLDWPPWHQLCGFLELPEHEHEPLAGEVEAFLADGPAPVFMGFGSMMPMAGSEHVSNTIAAFEGAARRSGCRAIIQADVDRAASDRVLFVKRTPHKQLFPRCAAVVHHAGAGTTHATLRAGVPSIPVPHVSDQFWWARELHRLGVAPWPLRWMKLTGVALASRINQVLADPRMKETAVRMSERMRTDDGPETAADLIEQAME